MARDPRLQWNQITAPNLEPASAALARAANSMNQGFNAGRDILSTYNEGQQEQEDSRLLTDLAGIRSEEEFDAFLQGGGLDGRNISSDMRNHVLGARSNFLNQAGARAGLAAADRAAQDWQYADDGRREMDQEGSRMLANMYWGEDHGWDSAVGQDERIMLARTLQAEAANEGYDGMVLVGEVIRNRVASGSWGGTLSDVIMAPGQFSAWNSVTGYARGEQGQNMNFTPSAEALAAADAVLAGNYQERTGGALNYVNYNVSQPSWFDNSFRRMGNHWFGTAGGGRGASGNNGPLGIMANMSAEDREVYEFINNHNIPFDVRQQAIMDLVGSRDSGQVRVDQRQARAAEDAAAEIYMGARADGSINLMTDPNAVYDMGMDATEGMDIRPSQRLAAVQDADGTAHAEPQHFSADPDMIPDATVDRVNNAISAVEQEQSSSIWGQLNARAEDLGSGDDPVQGFMDSYNIPRKEQPQWRRDLSSAAAEAGVEIPEMLAIYEALWNPRWKLNLMLRRAFFWMSDAEGITDRDAAIRIAQETYGVEADQGRMDERRAAERSVSELIGMGDEFAQMTSDANRLRDRGQMLSQDQQFELESLEYLLELGISRSEARDKLSSFIASDPVLDNLILQIPQNPTQQQRDAFKNSVYHYIEQHNGLSSTDRMLYLRMLDGFVDTYI